MTMSDTTITSVGRSHAADKFYRYKRPELTVKKEGRGNGTKTCLPNVDTVAKCIDRPVDVIMKFLSADLGVIGKGATLSGHHDKQALEDGLEKFIQAYVTCPSCGNPETRPCADKKRTKLLLECRACGSRSPANTRSAHYYDKTTKCMMKDLASASREKGGGDKKMNKKKGSSSSGGASTPQTKIISNAEGSEPWDRNEDDEDADKNSNAEYDNIVWYTDTSREAAMERREQSLGQQPALFRIVDTI